MAAQQGILIKSAEALERMAALGDAVLDKARRGPGRVDGMAAPSGRPPALRAPLQRVPATARSPEHPPPTTRRTQTGTVTEGRPSVVDCALLDSKVRGAGGWLGAGAGCSRCQAPPSRAASWLAASQPARRHFTCLPNPAPALLQCTLERALFLAASAENGSEHPLARAVLAHAAQRLECLGTGGGDGALPAELGGGPMEPASASEGGGSSGGEASHSTHDPLLLAVQQVWAAAGLGLAPYTSSCWSISG